MTTYNGERYLQQQLDSSASQIVLPDELVVCDDCSSDGTMRLLEAFAKTAPFEVRIYRNKKNLGYFRNFEKSSSLCTKDILFFCDQDDIWLPKKVGVVLKVFTESPEIGLIAHNMEHIDKLGNKIGVPDWIQDVSWISRMKNIPENSIYAFLATRSFSWSGCAMAYRRSWNQLLLPYPKNIRYHDQWVLHVLGICTPFEYITEALIQYRHHDKNAVDEMFSHPKKRNFFRFIPKFFHSIKKRLGLVQSPAWPRYLLIREVIQRLNDVPELKHPDILEMFRAQATMDAQKKILEEKNKWFSDLRHNREPHYLK